MWIRSAWWDGFWILSGFPIGLAMVVIGYFVPAHLVIIYLLVVFQTGHSIAPITVAWGHAGFRRVMLQQPAKYIGLPLAIMVLSTAVGCISGKWFPEYQFTDDTNTRLMLSAFTNSAALASPAWWMLAAYYPWNFYHFAMQNFGVLQIYRHKSECLYDTNQRRLDKAFCLLVQVAVAGALFLPYFGPHAMWPRLLYTCLAFATFLALTREAAISGRWLTPRSLFALSHAMCFILGSGLWVVALNGLNHWLVAIGLASHVDGNSKGRSPALFVGFVVAAGIALFWLIFWRNGVFSWNLRDMMQILLPYLGFRYGIGFSHFLYDRWIWKLSDSRVRATIGRDLMSGGAAASLAQPIPAMALSQRSA